MQKLNAKVKWTCANVLFEYILIFIIDQDQDQDGTQH